jgi:biotin carboxylase
MEASLPLLEAMDLEVTVVTDQVTQGISEHADRVVRAYPRDARAVSAALAAAGVDRADGVFSLGYENPPVIAELARVFDCPGLDLEVAINCTMKDRRLEILARSGIRVPNFASCSSVKAGLRALDEVGLPAVAKPVDATSSVGVVKLDRLATAGTRIAAALERSPRGRVVVEEYLEGTEHTVEGISADGNCHVTGFSDRNYDQKEFFYPFFFENGDTLPSSLSDASREAVCGEAVAAVRALDLEPAAFSCDVIVTPEGEPVILEVAARMSGARFGSEVVPLATGVNVLPNAVRLALGDELVLEELEPRYSRSVVLRYLPCSGGRVLQVGPLEWTDDRIYDVFWERPVSPGMVLPSYQSGKDVLAGVIVSADSVEEAEAVAERTLSELPIAIAAETGLVGVL